VAREPLSFVEAILEQTRQKVFIVRQGDDAASNVARWKNSELAPQATGGAAVVADRHDGGELSNRTSYPDLEATQQHRQAAATSDRDNGARRSFGGS
jgi:hypothetical protein